MKYKFDATALQAGEAVLKSASPSEINAQTNTVVAEIVDAVLDVQRVVILGEPAAWPNYKIPLAPPGG